MWTDDDERKFRRMCDRVIEGENGVHPTIATAARAEGLAVPIAVAMWDEKIGATHGGAPE